MRRILAKVRPQPNTTCIECKRGLKGAALLCSNGTGLEVLGRQCALDNVGGLPEKLIDLSWIPLDALTQSDLLQSRKLKSFLSETSTSELHSKALSLLIIKRAVFGFTHAEFRKDQSIWNSYLKGSLDPIQLERFYRRESNSSEQWVRLYCCHFWITSALNNLPKNSFLTGCLKFLKSKGRLSLGQIESLNKYLSSFGVEMPHDFFREAQEKIAG